MAARYDFTGAQRLEEGAAWSRVFTLASGDPRGPVADLTPRDLSSYTAASLVIRESPAGGAAGGREVLRLSLGDGLTLGGVAGTVTVGRTAAQMTSLGFVRGVWALELTDGSGAVIREIEGLVEYSRRVNRA